MEEMSSIWLHMATKRSKNILPPTSIWFCRVLERVSTYEKCIELGITYPLRLKVFRLRMIKAK